MPKESVYPRSFAAGDDDTAFPMVTVGWSREAGHVQLGVAPPERRIEGAGPTTVLTIADAIRADLEFVDKHRGELKWTGDSNYALELNTILLVHERGWWADLDRRGLNQLIVLCRKARDAAFGKDA